MNIKHIIHDNYLDEVDYKNLTNMMMKEENGNNRRTKKTTFRIFI